MKRGSVHLDWVISIGIFLVYVTSIFLLVKPTYKPVYEGEALLKILESNFKEKYYWNMTKVPLFIKSTNSNELTCDSSNNPPPYDFQMEYDFEWDKDKMFMKDENNNIFKDFDLGKSSDGLKKILKLKDSAISDSDYYIYLGDKDYSSMIDNQNNLIYQTNPYPCDMPSSCNTLNPPICFTYTFGVSETLKGIDESKLTFGLSNLRNGIGGAYPNSREYNLTIYKKNINREEAFWSNSGNVGQPSVNTQVYVKQYKDWILKEDGTREAVTVNIRSW